MDSKYIIKLWNGEYGNKARFIIERSKDGKQTEFVPHNLKDYAWVAGLTEQTAYKGWDSFEDEPVNDLADIDM